ncbi:hypothetical protein [Phycisphaera mikurensis]|uniref:Uncharacterized protein n=1 Tax=Phycisphaera mikurensis (strain NBRC 102666 / KCTC 22515 / FYK2301M01) TaxID=1142394 RepID=I0IEA6_PHYMF|nr:hypothetical protein [Phycisphaera mikurensis]MBB6441396.1 hypothetical protein [Phycisphaera mikurensis]BAM03594.1 hypothetical protein PSMK_14350 [Phycisphaera mikurensis NBRC 102666]
MRKPRAARSLPAARKPGRFARSPRLTLAFFAAVGLLLWGRLLLKEVPQTASAVDAASPAGAVEAPTPDPAAAPAGPGSDAGDPENRPRKTDPAGKVGG